MTKQLTIEFFVVVLLMGFALLMMQTPEAKASAPAGSRASFATSSNPVLAANTATIIAATSSCAATIISTSGVSAATVQFGDQKGSTLSGSYYTELIAASTTKAFDSGIYGCDLVRVFSYAAQTVSITQTN